VTGRRNRCFLWVVCGLLVVCLAGIELPEFLTLTNDTSNDFTISLTSLEDAAPLQIHAADAKPYDAAAVPRRPGHTDYGFRAALDTIAWRNPRDLLALHSFWRT
jgi:hypothetical protein